MFGISCLCCALFIFHLFFFFLLGDGCMVRGIAAVSVNKGGIDGNDTSKLDSHLIDIDLFHF